jgi:CDP-diacylglycerol--glycerol-3-phosphate 3-phosphatidyltransferase
MLRSSWPDLGRFWTIPNALSLLRLVLVIPIAVLLWQNGPLDWLLGLVVAAILSDWFDGRIARWTSTISDWGKVIDPIADKFASFMTVAALTFRSAEPTLPLWFFVLVMGRDVAIVAGSALIARRSGQILESAWAGKAATLWLALTVLAVVLQADAPVFNVCFWMTTGLLVFSFVVYLVRYARMPPPPRPVPPSPLSSQSDGSPSDRTTDPTLDVSPSSSPPPAQ